MKKLSAFTIAAVFAAGAASAQADITYLMWGSPQEAEAWAIVVDGFETLHPDINVTVEVADWDSY